MRTREITGSDTQVDRPAEYSGPSCSIDPGLRPVADVLEGHTSVLLLYDLLAECGDLNIGSQHPAPPISDRAESKRLIMGVESAREGEERGRRFIGPTRYSVSLHLSGWPSRDLQFTLNIRDEGSVSQRRGRVPVRSRPSKGCHRRLGGSRGLGSGCRCDPPRQHIRFLTYGGGGPAEPVARLWYPWTSFLARATERGPEAGCGDRRLDIAEVYLPSRRSEASCQRCCQPSR